MRAAAAQLMSLVSWHHSSQMEQNRQQIGACSYQFVLLPV